MRIVIKEILATGGKRKVQIYQRDDGSFGFGALQFSEDPLENCWIPHGRFSECIALSAEIAEREARGRIDWLADEHNDG
jgi:hypothetical protein